jgi:hypothetical protein
VIAPAPSLDDESVAELSAREVLCPGCGKQATYQKEDIRRILRPKGI